MATVACYFGQVLVLAMTGLLAGRALAAGMRGLAIGLAVVFALVAVSWDCRYTIAVKGNGNLVVGSCSGGRP